MNKYLEREAAPFGAEIWEKLDDAMKTAVQAQLVGRQVLDVEGPFGLGLKTISLEDEKMKSGLILSQTQPVVYIQKNFRLNTRDLANYELEKVSLNVQSVAETARACAQLEDDLIFHGTKGVPGLLTMNGSDHMSFPVWDEIGAAAESMIAAITRLDDAGFHGPYALILGPRRYNQLFRLYPGAKQSEMDHLKRMITGGIYKTPIIQSGGLLMAANVQCATIVLGQDLSIGYVGKVDSDQEFTLSESLTVRVREPKALCVLTE